MAVVSNGTTIIDNGAFDPAIPTGALTLIKSITASASASIEFINGSNGVVLDGTYSSYVFSFVNIHPANDAVAFQFNFSTDNGSSYAVTKTTTFFRALHDEADTNTAFGYSAGQDLAQSTSYQNLTDGTGNDNDQNLNGIFTLFNPSSTTYVKHFISTINHSTYDNYTDNDNIAGYGNTTSAINAINFKFSSGNIDDGTIKLYGVK